MDALIKAVKHFIRIREDDLLQQENEFACNYSSFLPGNLQRLYADVKEGERFGRVAIYCIVCGD